MDKTVSLLIPVRSIEVNKLLSQAKLLKSTHPFMFKELNLLLKHPNAYSSVHLLTSKEVKLFVEQFITS
jgi:hypothetical protein